MIQDTEHMNQMMQDSNLRNEMIDFMIQDTDHMNQWMLEDPQHTSMMIEEMKGNHDFMMGMAMPMIQDPGLRMQVMGHMTESPEAMAEMQQMMGGGMTGGMMSSEMMTEMMEDPEKRMMMIDLMTEHVEDMQELLTSGLSDDEFDAKMIELMEKHQQSMSEMMHDEPMGHDETTGHDESAGHDEPTMGMSASPQTYTVSIAKGSGVPGCEETNECYLPYSLEVLIGDTVSWSNDDSAAHTVTSGTANNPDGVFDSGMMLVNQSWEFTFAESGEYDYYCLLHPWMTGKIIVNEVEESGDGHDDSHS
jgi:plastocyanin